MPRVSVLIPARNRERHLPECLESVRRQTWRDHEIVLVDDGSTDGTARLAPLADVYRRTPPRGCSHARNIALGLARGEYIYVLDSDDYLAPRALELSVAFIQQTRADAVFSELNVVRDGVVVGQYGAREQTMEEVLMEKRIPHPSSMFRRSTLDVRYDETLPSAVDLDFLLRYMPGKVIRKMTCEPVYYYRWHGEQMGSDPFQNEVARRIRERWRPATAR